MVNNGYRYVCPKCLEDVKHDAWVVFDPVVNDYVISQVFDEEYCTNCEETVWSIGVPYDGDTSNPTLGKDKEDEEPGREEASF
jgi:hypothetical protein